MTQWTKTGHNPILSRKLGMLEVAVMFESSCWW